MKREAPSAELGALCLKSTRGGSVHWIFMRECDKGAAYRKKTGLFGMKRETVGGLEVFRDGVCEKVDY